MEVRQVEYFTAIARHGGLRHAADERNVSPGNLSGQITSLESELGVRLPERGSRHLTLTEAGVAFLERVEQAMPVLNTAREEMLVKLLASGEVTPRACCCQPRVTYCQPAFQRSVSCRSYSRRPVS